MLFASLILSLHCCWLPGSNFFQSKSSDCIWSENAWGVRIAEPIAFFFFRCYMFWHSAEWVLTFEFWGITYKAWLSTLDLLRLGLGCDWTFHILAFIFFFFFFWVIGVIEFVLLWVGLGRHLLVWVGLVFVMAVLNFFFF